MDNGKVTWRMGKFSIARDGTSMMKLGPEQGYNRIFKSKLSDMGNPVI